MKNSNFNTLAVFAIAAVAVGLGLRSVSRNREALEAVAPSEPRAVSRAPAKTREFPPVSEIGPHTGSASKAESIAQLQARKADRKAARAARQRSGSVTLNSGAGTLTYLDTVRAIDTRREPVAAANILRRIGPWALFTSPADPSRLNRFDKDDPPVLLNESTGQEGVATGVFAVKYREGADPHAIASTAGLAVASVRESTRWAFFEARNGQNLSTLLAELSAHAGVEQALVDVVYDRLKSK